MGETVPLFGSSFNSAVKVEARPEHITGDAGAIVLREIMERTGIMGWLERRLRDPRNPDLISYTLGELLRTRLALIGQGWRDQDDADRLREDPGLRVGYSDHRGETPLDGEHVLASQPTLSRLDRLISERNNLKSLRKALLELASQRVRSLNRNHRPRHMTLDVDSLPVEVHGHQTGSEWNGHYQQRIYHPLVASCAESGDMLDAQLRPGNVHTADGALDFLLDLVDGCKTKLCQVAMVRFDAGFPDEPTLAGLEERKVSYVARLKNNTALNRMAEPYLKRPRGRPPREPRTWFYEHTYQAGSWSKARRVVLVVVERPGELFLDHFWLITNVSPTLMPAEDVLERYRKRGKAEAHMGELMDVLRPALSSAKPDGAAELVTSSGVAAQNEALFFLHLIAYEILHCGRTQMERATHQGWSLRRFRERLLRVPARVILHARRLTFVIAEHACRDWQLLWLKLKRLRWMESPTRA